jgi:hypothetical protein
MNKQFKYILTFLLLTVSLSINAQEYGVSASIDKDSLTIGDQFTFKLVVPAATEDTIVFPGFVNDTITSDIEVIKTMPETYKEDKQLTSKAYVLAAFNEGSLQIPSQTVVVNPASDSSVLQSNPLEIQVKPVVAIDTLKVDTVYAERSGVVVFGKEGFAREIKQQIPDSVRNSMSPDSLKMLEDTIRQMLLQRFSSEVFRSTGLRTETEIAQIAGAPRMQLFVVNHKGVLNDYRIPGARDTVFVQEYDTVVASQALFTAYQIMDIDDELYKTPLSLAEVFYYIWRFIKNNWWWLTALIVLIMAALYYFLYYKKDKPVFRQKVKPAEPAHVIAFRELDRIKNEKLWLKNRVKDYYTDLTDTLRRYLEHRYDVKAMEKTSAEIMQLLDEENLLKDSLRMKMRDILERSDFVKFARSLPLPDENERSLKQAYDIVEQSKEIREYESELLDSELQSPEGENKTESQTKKEDKA